MVKPDALISRTISSQSILERSSGGGIGVIYKTGDTHLDRFVALKFIFEDLARDRQPLATVYISQRPTVRRL